MSVYPEQGRTAWITARRPARAGGLDPGEPRAAFLERERRADGQVVPTGVVLLTNKECPWKCLMCDLWKETTAERVPPGSIPRQIAAAVRRWAPARPAQVKLYNSGSFFDAAAIAPEDYAEIARGVAFAGHVVVECHPKLVGRRTLAFRDLLAGTLEVAMGLETAHPEVLRRLNKGFDLADFARAAAQLRAEGIAVRAFLLAPPPFLAGDEIRAWALQSARFAFNCGAGAVTFIPTRGGNGAMDELRAHGEFSPPTLAQLEEAQEAALALGLGRVFTDTWGLETLASCPRCAAGRLQRLQRINLGQEPEPAVACARCGGR